MNDIRISTGFTEHPKTKKLIKKAGFEAFYCLIRLWSWTAENRCRGILTSMDDDDIEIVAGWSGVDGLFVSTCEEVGWLYRGNEGMKVHDWQSWQPWVYDSENRSDKSRFSRMAKTHPSIFRELQNKNINAVSRSEYEELTKPQRAVNVSLTPAPAPAPVPSPSPVPSPAPRENKSSASGDAGRESYTTKRKRKLTGKRLESFERFWECFAYKKGKPDAADAWLDIPELTDTLVDYICEKALGEAKRRPMVVAKGSTPKMAQGWISSRRWEDEDVVIGPNTGSELTDGNIMVAQNWAASRGKK